jgi:hypothetical protein
MAKLEIAVAIDEVGIWSVSKWEDREDCGLYDDMNPGVAVQLYKINIEAPLPEPIETDVKVPEGAGETLKVEVD